MWENVPGWEHLFEVNTNGEVRNKRTGNLIKGDINNAGYPRVCLYDKYNDPPKQRFFRHRLVAEVFLENPNPNIFTEVDHLDNNKMNPSVENLEWVTKQENNIRRLRRFEDDRKRGPIIVLNDDGTFDEFSSCHAVAVEFDVTKRTVLSWLQGKSKSYPEYGILDIYRLY